MPIFDEIVVVLLRISVLVYVLVMKGVVPQELFVAMPGKAFRLPG